MYVQIPCWLNHPDPNLPVRQFTPAHCRCLRSRPPTPLAAEPQYEAWSRELPPRHLPERVLRWAAVESSCACARFASIVATTGTRGVLQSFGLRSLTHLSDQCKQTLHSIPLRQSLRLEVRARPVRARSAHLRPQPDASTVLMVAPWRSRWGATHIFRTATAT